MHQFKDQKDRTWGIVLTVDLIDQVRREVGIDLLSLAENNGKLLGQLGDDYALLAKTAWSLVSAAAKAGGVDRSDFLDSLRGDSLAEAFSAIMGGIVDFFPTARRETLKKFVLRAMALHDQIMDQVNQELDQIDPETEARALMSRFGKRS